MIAPFVAAIWTMLLVLIAVGVWAGVFLIAAQMVRKERDDA